jgi:hypothetical protein
MLRLRLCQYNDAYTRTLIIICSVLYNTSIDILYVYIIYSTVQYIFLKCKCANLTVGAARYDIAPPKRCDSLRLRLRNIGSDTL